MHPNTRQQRQHVPLPQKSELVWAKVSGWPWWPARVIPEPKKREDGQDGSLVCFLVDKTLARTQGSLPFEDVTHFYRFLNVAYGDKVRMTCSVPIVISMSLAQASMAFGQVEITRPCLPLQRLMQAVEEGRALLLDCSLLQQALQTSPAPDPTPLLLPYPAPTKEDVERRSARQLLKWLRGAAVGPEVCTNALALCKSGFVVSNEQGWQPFMQVACNTFRDQQTKRVLHAIRNNRTECQVRGSGCC